ncbi:MAG: CPBP family intramembrane metalloprotease [Lachnospiraceae bacterium]|nr:CPBP family intramembrane metalloprotease [Lachnospiraceae bacterium]
MFENRIYLFLVLSELITKRVTNVKSHYFVSLRVWKNKKAWLLSAIIPGILIVLGSLAYFFVFKYEYSGIFAYGQLLGNGNTITINNVFVFSFVCIFVAAFLIPIQLLELGEEIGWRGYLLDLQIEKCGERSAVLINGFEWGLAHLPLIYFGFNYSL